MSCYHFGNACKCIYTAIKQKPHLCSYIIIVIIGTDAPNRLLLKGAPFGLLLIYSVWGLPDLNTSTINYLHVVVFSTLNLKSLHSYWIINSQLDYHLSNPERKHAVSWRQNISPTAMGIVIKISTEFLSNSVFWKFCSCFAENGDHRTCIFTLWFTTKSLHSTRRDRHWSVCCRALTVDLRYQFCCLAYYSSTYWSSATC